MKAKEIQQRKENQTNKRIKMNGKQEVNEEEEEERRRGIQRKRVK